MLEELEGYDWGQAFQYAGEKASDDPDNGDWVGQYGEANIDVAITSQDIIEPCEFSREDVAELFGHEEGEHDVLSWICYGRLKNGLYFYLEAGCDYTGWD